MKRLAIVSMALAFLLFAAAPPASATAPMAAEGSFTVTIDFATLNLTPKGSNCLLEVEGTLFFEGTLEGQASGKTSALVFAPCDEVGDPDNPPGTFRDVFMSKGEFTGMVNGTPATADLTYQGQVSEGGDIEALIRLSKGLEGVLEVEAVVAEGGAYSGLVRVE